MENDDGEGGWLLTLATGGGILWLLWYFFPHSFLLLLAGLFFLAGLLYPTPKR